MVERNPGERLTADIASAHSRIEQAATAGKYGSPENLHDVAWSIEATKLAGKGNVTEESRKAMEAGVDAARDKVNALAERETQLKASAGQSTQTSVVAEATAPAPKAKHGHGHSKAAKQAEDPAKELRASLLADVAVREAQTKEGHGNARNSEVIEIEKSLAQKEKLSVDDIRDSFKKMGLSQEAHATASVSGNHSLPTAERTGEPSRSA